MGADRRWCAEYAIEKVALLRTRSPVRFPSRPLPSRSKQGTRTHATHETNQLPAFDALHELQPMAVCDQSVGLNFCARAQAAHCAFYRFLVIATQTH